MTKRERRDAIAIEAMNALIALVSARPMDARVLAASAYEIADMMMHERAKADERERIKGT